MTLKYYSNLLSLLCLVFVLLISTSCSDSGFEYTIETKLNLYRISPLTALLHISTPSRFLILSLDFQLCSWRGLTMRQDPSRTTGRATSSPVGQAMFVPKMAVDLGSSANND